MASGEIRFALAQISALKGNIAENLRIHQQYCVEAAKEGSLFRCVSF